MPEQFGRYTLIKHVASGGMAEIWLALQPGPGGAMKPLVIKRILPHNVESAEFLSMFLDEARIASNLNHQNIAQIFDVGEVDGRYYIAMEYVHGVDVRSLYRRLGELQRPLPIEVALYLVSSICAGLHSAHTKKDLSGKPIGIVHRDVSPQNVLLDFNGGVKLIDFGIAKATNKLGATKSGVIKGKTAYLSPEQARGEELDSRSDVFAAGVVLYELTVGRRPFEADNEYGVVLKIASCDFKAPRAVRHNYPSSLERIALKAMAPNREARFATARQFEEALRAWGHDNRLKLEPNALAALLHETFPERARTDVADEIGSATDAGILRQVPSGATPQSGLGRAAGDERTPGAVSRTGSGTAAGVAARRRWLVPTIAVAGLAIVGGVALYAVTGLGGDDDHPVATKMRDAPPPPRPRPGAEAADKTDVPVTAAPKPSPDEKKWGTPVEVSFVSTPPGAKVFAKGAGESLGTAPFKMELPTSRDAWRFEFRLDGHAAYSTEVLIEAPRAVEATLSMLPAPPPPSTADVVAVTKHPRAGHKDKDKDKDRPATAAPTAAAKTASTPGSRIVDPFK